MTTLIRNATIVSIDADRQVFSPGAIAVHGGQITDIGPNEQVEQRIPHPKHVIEGEGKVVLPGFVSAHNHLGYAVFRGRAEDFGYGAGRHLYLPMADILRREERRDIGWLAAAELLRGGVTTVFEMEEDGDALASSIDQLGMRGCVGVMVSDVDIDKRVAGETVFSEQRCEEQLAQAIGFAESQKAMPSSRISPVLAANGLATSSPTQLRALRDAADRLEVRLSIHLGTGEAPILEHLYGAGTIDFARENGFLAPDVIAVHGYKLTQDEVVAFAQTGAHLAHCPQINSFRGLVAPLRDYRTNGVNVGLGVDNFFSDTFDVMRSCISCARMRENDPQYLPAAEVLALATVGAARALGLEAQIGSLEVGKRADLQIVDMRRYGLSPVNNPISTLVYHAHAKDVDMVMVDGEVVVESGVVLAADEDVLVSNAAQAAEAAWQRFTERFGE